MHARSTDDDLETDIALNFETADVGMVAPALLSVEIRRHAAATTPVENTSGIDTQGVTSEVIARAIVKEPRT